MSGDTSQKSFLTQGDSGKAITEIEDLRESIMKINDRENFKKFSIFLNNLETYITIFKIDSQRESAVWLRKLKQGLCINVEG